MWAKAQWKSLYHIVNLKKYTNRYFAKGNKNTEGCKVFQGSFAAFLWFKTYVYNDDKFIDYYLYIWYLLMFILGYLVKKSII